MIFCLRTGGDEFVMVVRCGRYTFQCNLGIFYDQIKRDINSLGAKIKKLIFYENGVLNEKEWKEAKEKLDTAKDRKGNQINMRRVGISTGIFVPYWREIKEKGWLAKADKVALENAKTTNGLNKNGVSIYDEESGGLIPAEKVLKCLEKGVCEGRQ